MTNPLSEIEKLVNKVAKAALATDQSIAFQDRVDALKVLTPYYLALKKEQVPDENGESTMAELAKSVTENGDAEIRGG